MSLSPPAATDTRALFRPVSSALLALLRGLSADDWHRPTLARAWTVRDIVAHLVDLSFRRVSFHRDQLAPPPPPFPIQSEEDFVRFINGLNHEWVAATTRCSPQVLTELFELASADLSAFFEAQPLDAPGLFGVSWAGEQSSPGWFDTGREFTELWHHQMQIRLAVGAAPLADARYLRAVLDIAMRGLPYAYRGVDATEGATVAIEASGPAGGAWTLKRDAQRWTLWEGTPDQAATRVRLSDDEAWRLLFNALPFAKASASVQVEGRRELAMPLLRARSVVV
ncbi:MAG: maleylpyruvate isomerase family mycothiol-dependent enzyme [Acidobacteria bacterium]|nr:maleylpyruvate isomerase family mycothiol-dependent enzyme [Acidobacteriota bacterium]